MYFGCVYRVSSHLLLDTLLPVVGHASHPCCVTRFTGLSLCFGHTTDILLWGLWDLWGDGQWDMVWQLDLACGIKVSHPELWHLFLVRQWPLDVSIAQVNFLCVCFYYKWCQQMFFTSRTAPWNDCFQTRKARVNMQCFASAVDNTMKHRENGTFSAD